MKLKNITPRQIATYTAIGISAIQVAILVLLYKYSDWSQYPMMVLITWFLGSFIISYGLILFVIQWFIFRKIKLIYKNIREFKTGKINKPVEEEIDVDTNIFRDVEEEVKEWTQQKQQEIDELRTLENYRREYIGNVSHELKTPVFNIQGYIQTLIDGGIDDPAINEKYLQRASHNLDRLITIVEDLDVITRLESGEMILDKKAFEIRPLVQEVFEDLEFQAREKEISLRFKEGASTNFMVYADMESLRTVLMNLISNSVKYGKEGGRTSVGFYDMGNHILVEVSDNGIGIDQKHLRHLFDRFYRVDKSRSRHEGGSGLGLSIVKHILEAHDQPINVRSTPGVGTTFGFTLTKEKGTGILGVY